MELTVLGIAWKRGPCTTYALMKELASSTSTYYKTRAGTAYPLVERLIKSKYLAASEVSGAKGEKLVEVTEMGIAALRRWLTDSISLEEVAHTVDLLRLRVFYLGAATSKERSAFIDNALVKLREQLAACEIACARYRDIGDVFSQLATEGVMHETSARITWLTEIRAKAAKLPSGKPLLRP